MKHYNARPSSVPNIGQDITGAHRHHHDTYETPEELRTKAFRKASDKRIKALKAEYMARFQKALRESTEAAKACLIEYETRKAILSCEYLEGFEGDASALRALVIAKPYGEEREALRKVFNRLNRKLTTIKYRIRPIELSKYFNKKTKDQFREVNGKEVSWRTDSQDFDRAFLASRVRAVQFGNSLSENERIYVSEKLVESIKIMDQHFTIDWSRLGFSYGARGKAGSVAHYQDSKQVLAFNRGIDGAFIHELGHAIDYWLGLPSDRIPRSILQKYSDKLGPEFPNKHYYMKRKEIFARMFEAFVHQTVPDRTEFMIFINQDRTIPDLDQEAMDFLAKELKSIMR